MKKIMLVLVFLLLPFAYAYDDIDVYKIRLYRGDDRISGVDYDGDIEAIPGEELEWKIYIENRNNTERIDGVRIWFRSDDLDIDESSGTFSINSNDENSEELKFKIPKDADEDEYDAQITIEGDLPDGTLFELFYNYTITIDEEAQASIYNYLDNISINMQKTKERVEYMHDKFNTTQALQNEREKNEYLTGEVKVYQDNEKEMKNKITELETENNRLLDEEKSTNAKYNSKVEEYEKLRVELADEVKLRQAAQDKQTQMFIFGAIVVGAIWGIVEWNKRKTQKVPSYLAGRTPTENALEGWLNKLK